MSAVGHSSRRQREPTGTPANDGAPAALYIAAEGLLNARMKRVLLFAFAAGACANPRVAPQASESSSAVAPEAASAEPAPTAEPDPATNHVVVPTSKVEWEQLNPARGDNSPKAGTLWGDRNGPGPSGFLLKPVDGFRSPPHAHTAFYRGVVIEGSIHNDAPDAADAYLPAGSYWTQPAGGIHVTAAKGVSLAYIEVEGAFDVVPADRAPGSKERATVIVDTQIEWSDPPGAAFGAKVTRLWGEPLDGGATGSFVKLPAGLTAAVRSDGPALLGVVIRGRPTLGEGGPLEPGSFFSSKGEAAHRVSCGTKQECVVYVRAEGKFDLAAASPGE